MGKNPTLKSVEQYLRDEIQGMTQALELVKSRIVPTERNVMEYVVEAERLKFAIQKLNTCLHLLEHGG